MEIIQNEKYGIIRVTVKRGTETEITPEFEVAIKKIIGGNCSKDTITIADSVESGLSALLKPLKAA